MDVKQWNQVLFEWIKASELTDDSFSLEQVQLEDFFLKFYYKLHGDTCDKGIKIKITDFLEENFHEYEILYNETSNISPQDYTYIYSILLYYSCVTQENRFFQTCCTLLNEDHQLFIARFLEYFLLDPHFSKASVRTAIKLSVQLNHSPSPINSPLRYTVTSSSPIVSPAKSDQLLTPSSTPNKEIINQKLKELKTIKSQLDSERFERNMMEMEINHSKETIDKLVQKCQSLSNEAKKLRSGTIIDNQDENRSPNTSQSDKHIRNKLQKEIQKREDLISDLKYENDNINAANKRYKEKVITMEKQMKDMYNKILDLDASLNDLRFTVDMKNEKIQILQKENKEFSEHISLINETRSVCKDTSSSSDLMEFSCSTYITVNNHSDYSESLGKSIVDLQVKEKDIEICKLRELLSAALTERNALEQLVSELKKQIKHGESFSRSFEEKVKEPKRLQVPNWTHTYERDKIQNVGDDTVISKKSDDEADWNWSEDDDEKKSSCGKRLSTHDKSGKREHYQHLLKQKRNKIFNDTRRRSSTHKQHTADASTTSHSMKEDEGDY